MLGPDELHRSVREPDLDLVGGAEAGHHPDRSACNPAAEEPDRIEGNDLITDGEDRRVAVEHECHERCLPRCAGRIPGNCALPRWFRRGGSRVSFALAVGTTAL